MEKTAAQKTKTRKIAAIMPWCTGCGGSPVCMVYCRKNALVPVKDMDHYPFSVMTVSERDCIGCSACVAKGENGLVLSGCPWNAITMVPLNA
jgi:ferredoxin